EQETECTVRFGTLSAVDVEVPAALRRRWEIEGSDVLRRTDLGDTPGGGLLARLELGKEVSDKVRLRFRSRRPPSEESGLEHPIALEVPWIRVVEGQALPFQIRVVSEPGI